MLIIRSAARRSSVWQVGYEKEDDFRIFAIGTSEAGLQAILAKERERNADTITIEDRR